MPSASGAVDLGKYSSKSEAKRVTELTAEQEQLAAQFAAEHPEDVAEPAGTPVITAFVVYQQLDGHWIATSDVTEDLDLERQATADDMYAAAAVIQKDVLMIQTANTSQQLALRTAQIMQQQRQAQAIAQQLDLSKH